MRKVCSMTELCKPAASHERRHHRNQTLVILNSTRMQPPDISYITLPTDVHLQAGVLLANHPTKSPVGTLSVGMHDAMARFVNVAMQFCSQYFSCCRCLCESDSDNLSDHTLRCQRSYRACIGVSLLVPDPANGLVQVGLPTPVHDLIVNHCNGNRDDTHQLLRQINVSQDATNGISNLRPQVVFSTGF